ncbi:MAG: acyl carrier protein [Acetobacteraceae bacterium]|nr:acyl carrier protein [Acetobacteraceae bacterium]
MDGVRERLQQIMGRILEVEPSSLTPETDFFEDHGADSMMALEAVVLIEQEFNIEVPEDRISQMRTFAGLEKVVTELLGGSAVAAS